MYPNINTGVGQLMATGLVDQAYTETTGRFYIVGKSTLAGLQEAQGMYPGNYPDGTPLFYSTIKLALAACLANRGDVIFVMPGHTENIANATDLNVNVAGVTIIGLGTGNLRPVLTLTTAITATITFSAANTQMCNMIIDGTGFDAITSVITVTGAGVILKNNQFTLAGATNQAAIGLTTTAAGDALMLSGNTFTGTTDAGTTNAIQLVGADDCQIINNFFYGAYTTSLGPINGATTDSLRILIQGNTLMNVTASSTKAIVLTAGSTGMIRDNRIAIRSGTAPITGAAMDVGGNYYTAAAGVTAGTLL